MFERNRIDSGLQTTAVTVEIALGDGDVVKGRLIVSAARSLTAVLNSEAQFLEFETHAGERSLIAKSTLKAVKIIAAPTAVSLAARVREPASLDPHAVLGIDRGASWDDTRRAFLQLSKTYHPDRYAGVELPAEVRDYFAAMIGRINAAYAALEEPHQVQKHSQSAKSKPVFTSSQSL